MAQRSSKTIPRLVVKIVGSKQVKQFIEEPQEDETPPVVGIENDIQKSGENQEVMESRKDEREAGSSLMVEIKQVPERQCVTAPSGDRSRSYIHPKTPHASTSRAAPYLDTTQERDELSAAVRQQLCEWQISSLRSTRDQAASLDPSCSGTLNKPDITQIFLQNNVPLTLPTFSLLLQTFSDENDPSQIHYEDLLQFLHHSAFPNQKQE